MTEQIEGQMSFLPPRSTAVCAHAPCVTMVSAEARMNRSFFFLIIFFDILCC